VPGDEQVGCQFGERVDRGADDRGEEGAAQVQAAEQCVQPGDAGQPLCVPDDVDGAGVPAAGHDDQSPAAHVHDEGLVVEDQRVGFPRGAGPLLVGGGHAVFEVGGAVDLAGDQDGAAGEQRRLAALDHVEALAGQRALAEGRKVVGPAAGQGEAAAGPRQRVDDHRQGPGTAPPGEPGQAAGVVEVAVAEHHGVHSGQVEAEPAGVGDHRIRGQPGVEQHGRRGVAAADGDQRGKAVLGHQPDVGTSWLELGRLGGPGCERRSGDGVVAGEQGVVDVVDQRGDDDVVHRLQCDRVGRAARDRVRHRGADVVAGGRFSTHGCYSWVAGSTISMSPVATS
jgi:hypothetical protein